MQDLFINGRFLTQRTSGVQSFAREVCRELIKDTNLILLVPRNAVLQDNEFSSHIKRVGIFGGHFWEQLSLPFFLNKQQQAILLNLCNTGPLLFNNQVCTVHDLAFLKNKKWFNPIFSMVYTFLIPKLITVSKGVLTVSSTIKNELIETYQIKESKIAVISNKVGSDLIKINAIEPLNKKLVSKDFFLMVGTNNQRKNLAFVQQLFKEGTINKKLVIAGGNHKSFRNASDEDLCAENIIHLDYINNENLAWLYKNAIALINPSLYEGFGIPNMEAMFFNCTVLCSDIPVFRETCADAAFYFSPTEKKSLEKCINNFLENSQLAESKKHLGKNIVDNFQNQKRSATILNILKA